jgi:drug/metabolite transporter (DMT)-like permease
MAEISEIKRENLLTRDASNYAYAMILATVTIWGGSFASTKYALAQAEPMVILWLRLAIAMPVLFAGILWERSIRLPSKNEAVALFLMGFQGIFFHQAIQGYAMKTAGAANANWMMIATPALVAILGRIFLKEKISGRGICGMILAAAGVALVIGRGTVATANSGGFGSIGDLIMLLSVLNWAIFLIVSRRVLKKDLSPAFVIFWEMFFALMVATPFVIFIGSDFSVIPSFSSGTWGALIFLGAFSSALAYIFWFKALSVFTVAKVAVFQFLQPIAGVVISYFLVGERFTLWLFAGGAMILCGVWLVNKR